MWTDDEQDHEGEQTDILIAEEYDIADYVIIQPWKSYTGMMGDLANVLYPEEVAIKWLLNEMVGSLEAFNKYAVAASVISKEPVITTEDLMDEYSQPEEYREKFFGPEMAKEIVLDNPKTISDMIENISIEEVIHEYEKNKIRKQLKGKKITEEGVP